MPAVDIRLGHVVCSSETDFRLVECFDASHDARTLTAHCQLKRVFKTALQSYQVELDKVSLADITRAKPTNQRPGSRSVSVMPMREIKSTSWQDDDLYIGLIKVPEQMGCIVVQWRTSRLVDQSENQTAATQY